MGGDVASRAWDVVHGVVEQECLGLRWRLELDERDEVTLRLRGRRPRGPEASHTWHADAVNAYIGGADLVRYEVRNMIARLEEAGVSRHEGSPEKKS